MQGVEKVWMTPKSGRPQTIHSSRWCPTLQRGDVDPKERSPDVYQESEIRRCKRCWDDIEEVEDGE